MTREGRPRSGESGQVLAPALLLFGILVAHALLETARDALFLARLPPQHLAWAYLLIAAAALVAMLVLRRWALIRHPRRLLVATLAIAAAGTAVLAATVGQGSSLVFVLYVWTGLVATLVVPTFWTMVDRSNRVVEAKRRFARISAGGVLGALVGSALAGLIGHALPAQSLVAVAAVVFAVVAAVTVAIAPRPIADDPVPRAEVRRPSRPRSTHYLRLLLGLGVVSTVTLTLVDLTFKRAFAESFDAAQLATAFGALYTALNLVALVIQLAVTSKLLERIGVTAALTILPALLTLTALGFVVTSAFASLLLLKLSDGGLRHSLHRVATEILYLPLPALVRDRWKPIVDAIGQRGGQMLAALMWLALTALGLATTTIVAALAVIALAWLGLLRIARRAYVAQFRSMVVAGEIERDVRVGALDADSSRLLVESLSSPDELEALAALDVLAHAGEVPAFVLYHPRDAVVRRALELLAGDLRPDVSRVLEHLVDHADPKIRAAALAAAGRTGGAHDQLRAALDATEPHVRAVAAIWLADHGELADVAAERLDALAHGTVDDRVALASAIESRALPRFQPIVDELLANNEPRVLSAALRVLRRAPQLASSERLLALLEDPYVRGEVRRVFVAVGPRGLAALVAALDDARTPLPVRRHLPRTISRFPSPAAAAALASRLMREPDGTTEFKILRALGRLRTDNPGLPIDEDALRSYLRRSVADAARYTALLDRVADDDRSTMDLIRELLQEKRGWALEHAFRALGILYPRGGVRSLHTALVGPSKERRAAAHEILEPMLPADLRLALFAIVDELPPESRARRLAGVGFAQHALDTDEQLLLALLRDPSESLKCLTAHHIAEQHLDALRQHLDRLRHDEGGPFVMAALDQAIARLDA